MQKSSNIYNLWIRSKSWEYGCRTFWLKKTRISVSPSVLLWSPFIALLVNNINLFCPTLSLATKNGASTSLSSKSKNGWGQTNRQHPVRSLTFILARNCYASGEIWRGLSIIKCLTGTYRHCWNYCQQLRRLDVAIYQRTPGWTTWSDFSA
jgi:hypothetical protein